MVCVNMVTTQHCEYVLQGAHVSPVECFLHYFEEFKLKRLISTPVRALRLYILGQLGHILKLDPYSFGPYGAVARINRCGGIRP